MKTDKTFVNGHFDKGTEIWRMTRQMYEDKCIEEFISLDNDGNSRYDVLNEDPTPKIKGKIKYSLNKF
jgi:hypothetical protein